MNFNWVDVLLILLVLLSVWGGWRRGFVLSLLDLVRWAGSLAAGLFFYQAAADLIERVTGWQSVWNRPAGFILMAAVAGVVIQVAGWKLVRRLPKNVHEGRVNKGLGILPGLANGLLTAVIFSTLLLSVPFGGGLAESAEKSGLADRLAGYSDRLQEALTPIFEPALEQALKQHVSEPESEKSVELPFKVENPRPRPDLEAEMLELINRERAAVNLKPLEADPEMAEVARKHSADMFARGYFAHDTPEGKDPFGRMRDDQVKFRTAGENLALAPNLKIAHDGLMNSPGHRANILRPEFGRVGIGILDSGRHGIMVTQDFRN